MFMRKHKKAPQRKRIGRRKYRRNKPKAVTTLMKGVGFADTVFAKLTYVERLEPSIGGAIGTLVFAGNSIFDPNVSGGGHQPLYRDQYAAVYNQYRVLGSSIKVDVINVSNNSSLIWCIEPNTSIGSPTDISQIYEQSRAGAPKIVPVASRISSRLKKYSSTRKVCGLTKAQSNDSELSSQMGGNPNNLWYWNLFFQSADNTSVVDCVVMVKLVYYVQFFDRVQAAQS